MDGTFLSHEPAPMEAFDTGGCTLRARIVACVKTAEGRGAAERAANGDAVCVCTNERVLLHAVAENDITAVIWEMERASETTVVDLACALSKRMEQPAVLVRLDLTRAAAQQLVALTTHLPQAQPSLRGYDDFATDVVALTQATIGRDAHAAIMKRIARLLSTPASDILCTAVAAGHRRASVDEFSRLCCVPVRTLEWRLSTSNLACARHLLALMLALHSLWRLDILGWNAKRVAVAAGFQSYEAWTHYIARHAGARPRALLQAGGFRSVLERCVADMVRTRSAL